MADSKRREGEYDAEVRFTLAEAPGLRVRQLKRAAGTYDYVVVNDE